MSYQKISYKKIVVIFALGLGIISTAQAGNWQLKLGTSLLAPNSNNGVLAGAKADVSYEFNLTPSVEYFFGDSPFSAELLLAVAPFKHDIQLDGVEAAEFKHLPPTITAKYHLKNSTRFTPYIGLGLTVAVPWDEKLRGSNSKLEADVTYGTAGQLGFNFQPADATNWGVFADVRYAQVESDVTLDGKEIGTLKVNPLVYTLGYSVRF
ncbi:OmpW/AlkL family protein [Acinetobacter sp. KS-LM10]|uniref:OmpW/AlkL family protein n=1 Tax=Acinetobacter sp. KS-LM10 TaxID=3120518 RepID=UPI0030CDA031